MYETAKSYIARGWACFPIIPMGKTPACQNGLHDATTEPEGLAALWGDKTNLNIGIATGTKSGFWVLDLDSEEAEKTMRSMGHIPETLTSITANGKHLLFKMPEGVEIRNSASRIAKGVDVRGNGGYIVAPPSVHQTGIVYDWENPKAAIADAPAWLVELAKKQETVCQPVAYEPLPEGLEWTADDVLDMLACIDADCGHDDWVSIGMALHQGGWTLGMWDQWSRGGSKYKQGECFKRWRSFNGGGGITFGTLVHIAQSWGWKPKQKESTPLDFSNIGGVDMRAFKERILGKKQEPEKQIPAPKVGGLIEETLNWVNSNAFKVQPELALMNIIAALGAVFGRRYYLQNRGTKPRIYMVGIAETGQGKENSRKCLKKLMKAAGLEQFIGPDDIRSDAGLIMELKENPSIICHIDEFGMFLRGLTDEKSPAYLRNISSMVTRLYSEDTFKRGLTAGEKGERMTLESHNLCIYGTTTLSEYAKAMKRSNIASGEMNRFIVLKSSVDFPPPNHNVIETDPPEHLVKRWEKFKPKGLADGAPDLIEPDKTAVKMSAEISKRVTEIFDYQDEQARKNHASGLGALWARYQENILRVAMIFAIARDPDKPELNNTDIDNAQSIVENSIRFMMRFAENNMYENEYQKTVGQFMAALEKEGSLTRSEMMRIMRVKSKELDAIETMLVETEQIEITREGKSKRYKAL